MFVELFSGQVTVDQLAVLGSLLRSGGHFRRKPADWLLLLQPAVSWLGKHMQVSVVF